MNFVQNKTPNKKEFYKVNLPNYVDKFMSVGNMEENFINNRQKNITGNSMMYVC